MVAGSNFDADAISMDYHWLVLIKFLISGTSLRVTR